MPIECLVEGDFAGCAFAFGVIATPLFALMGASVWFRAAVLSKLRLNNKEDG